jgi:hypothetical protein
MRGKRTVRLPPKLLVERPGPLCFWQALHTAVLQKHTLVQRARQCVEPVISALPGRPARCAFPSIQPRSHVPKIHHARRTHRRKIRSINAPAQLRHKILRHSACYKKADAALEWNIRVSVTCAVIRTRRSPKRYAAIYCPAKED